MNASDGIGVIPQFFYDLISRVLPGGLFLLILSWALNSSTGRALSQPFNGAPALQGSAIALALIFFAAAYLVGQLLAPISDFYERKILARVFRPYFNDLRNILNSDGGYPSWIRSILAGEVITKGEDPDHLSDRECQTFLFLCYDSLRAGLPDVGARSAKIRAEYRMHGAIAVAAALGSVIHLLASFLSSIVTNLAILAGFGGLFLVATWGLVRTFRIWQKSVFHNYAAWRRECGHKESPESPVSLLEAPNPGPQADSYAAA